MFNGEDMMEVPRIVAPSGPVNAPAIASPCQVTENFDDDESIMMKVI